MFKLLLSVFLIINSLIGVLFYEDTAFGDYLNELELGGQLIFFLVNFIGSHLINIFLKTPLSFLSTVGLLLLLMIAALGLSLAIPYWIIYDLFDATKDHIFPGIMFFLFAVTLLSYVMRPFLQALLQYLIQFNHDFWEGLKANAIQSAINKASKNQKK
jgi:hypothetical protein